MIRLYTRAILTNNRLFFFQGEDGIRDLVRSRGLGDVYKRQDHLGRGLTVPTHLLLRRPERQARRILVDQEGRDACLLYTSDAADERSSVDLGGRRIIKKKIDITSLTVDLLSQNHHIYVSHSYIHRKHSVT